MGNLLAYARLVATLRHVFVGMHNKNAPVVAVPGRLAFLQAYIKGLTLYTLSRGAATTFFIVTWELEINKHQNTPK